MNNNTPISLTFYRTLIILQLIFPFIGPIIDFLREDPTLKLLDEMLYIEPQLWELVVGSIAGIIILIIIVGLLFRKEWARKAFLYTYLPSFLIFLLPFMHWSYMTSISTLLNALAFVSSGMLVLILMLPQLYQPLFNKDTPSK